MYEMSRQGFSARLSSYLVKLIQSEPNRTVQPGPKVKQGKSNRKQQKILASIAPSQTYAGKMRGIEEGCRATAEQIMDPDCVMFLPSGTAPRVTGTHYRREFVLQPDDVTQEFSGIIQLRPNLEEFLLINTTNGNPVDVTNAKLRGLEIDWKDVEIVLDDFYFPAFYVEDSTGNKVGQSVLKQVNRADVWGQSPITGEWVRGHINQIDSKCGTSPSCSYENLVYHEPDATVNQACTVWVGQVDDEGNFTYSRSAASGVGNVAGSLTGLSGTDGVAVSYAIQATTDQQSSRFDVRARIDDLDLLDFNPVEFFAQPQVESDGVYTTLRDNHTGLRMNAASLLCSFRGSTMNDGGLIAVARVPEGTKYPMDSAQSLYNWIAALPYDNYTGPVKKGGHTFWMPKTLGDIKYRLRSDPLDTSNCLLIAFIVPGSSAGQTATFSIVAKSTWEWIYDSQSMPQYRAPPGWLYLEALYSVLGQFNPSGENPGHMEKIKKIAKKVASNPAVRALAQQALQLGVTEVKKVLPALIAGVAL